MASSDPFQANKRQKFAPPEACISVATLAGREVASMVADLAWMKRDILMQVPGLTGRQLRAARLFHNNMEVCYETSLGTVGVNDGTGLQLVLDRRGGGEIATASADGTVKVWDAESGACIRTKRSRGHRTVKSIEFSADGRAFAAASADAVALWKVESDECVRAWRVLEVESAAFSPDGMLVLTAFANGSAQVWNVESGKCLYRLPAHYIGFGGVTCAAFSSDGELFVTSSWSMTSKLWNTASGKCIRTLEFLVWCVNSVAFSPDKSLLVTASCDGTATLWNVSSGARVRTLRTMGEADAFRDPCHVAEFSPDGALVLTAHSDTARLWSADSGRCLRIVAGHAGAVLSAAFSPDGSLVLTTSADHAAKLWNTDSGACLRTFEGHVESVLRGVFSPPLSQADALR